MSTLTDFEVDRIARRIAQRISPARPRFTREQHDAAVAAFERTGDVAAAQKILGHKDPDTTRHFLGIDPSPEEGDQ